ncbi:MAG: MFS transporter [Geminicoccaceae bacterium]
MTALPSLAALSLAYVVSQFFRTAIAVVAPELAHDLGLDPARLGVLSSAWFWAFAAAQLPIGIALDRWGPRRTVGIVFLSAGLGCGVFALADGLAAAVVGQVLIGIGCAPVFMGSLVVLARFCEPRRFAMLSTVLLAIGSGGTILATAPLALAAELVGWRGAFAGMAVAVLLVAVLVVLLVRDHPPGAVATRPHESLHAIGQGLRDVIGKRALWAILPMSFTGYAVLITVRGLWAGPYLATVLEMTPLERGNVLLVMSLAMIAGNLAYGQIERRFDVRRPPVLLGSLLVVAVLALLALGPAVSSLATTLLLSVFGAAGMTYALLMAQGRRFLDPHELGRGLTLMNCACFAGAATLQALSGLVMRLAEPAGEAFAYRALFAFLALALLLALAVYRRSTDLRRDGSSV